MTEICRYIHSNGERCGSPALREQPLCYHHHRLRGHHHRLHADLHPTTATTAPDGVQTIIHPVPSQHVREAQRNPLVAEYYGLKTGPLQIDLPPLEDRHSIQIALSLLIRALAADRIDIKRATALLYGLQVASANAARLAPPADPDTIVIDTVRDEETGEDIAPDEPANCEKPRHPNVLQQLLDEFDQEYEPEAETAEGGAAAPPSSHPDRDHHPA